MGVDGRRGCSSEVMRGVRWWWWWWFGGGLEGRRINRGGSEASRDN